MENIINYINENPRHVRGSKMVYKSINELSINEEIETLDFDMKSEIIDIFKTHLYIGMNLLDQAHDIVTPYSWPSATSFGGAPKHADNNTQAIATYLHATVHRSEGEHVGEFGTGFNNSCYWFSQVNNNDILQKNISNKLINYVNNENHINNIIINFINQQKHGWSHSNFIKLCEYGVNKKDINVINFCNEVINKEWHIVYDEMINHMFDEDTKLKLNKL